MKPFDLEAAKNGAKLITRDGRPARIVCWDKKDNKGYPLVVLIETKDNIEIIDDYTLQGMRYKSESDSDLFLAPIKHEGWVNVYHNETFGHNYTSKVYVCREEAECAAIKDARYLATCKIEWEK